MARSDGIAGRHLLLVEPHDDTRSRLCAFFQTFGIQVTEAREHAWAARAVAERPADILLVDVGKFGGASAELVRRARSAQRRPVVAVAMSGGSAEQATARGAGFDVFVKKPFDPAELLIDLVQRLHR